MVADIRPLAEVDGILGGLCGPATPWVLQRQFEVFGDLRFERLAGLSNSHLYRLRQTTTYRRRRATRPKPHDQPRVVALHRRGIGARPSRSPRPSGACALANEALPQADAQCCPGRRYGPSSPHLRNIPSPT